MFHVRCFSLVPYSVEQMFNLINDVHSYTEFVPGCSIIKIINQSHGELIAEINLITNGIVKSLITHNFFIKNESIIIFLVKSPFKSFYGCWKFVPITDVISSIEYVSYYEFRSKFTEKICNYPFRELYKNINKIFISRANQIYGKL